MEFQQDNIVLPFFLENANASGRIARLGACVQTILEGHNYPDPVAFLLSEAITLTALLGSALKTEGKLTLQTQTDGLVNMVIVNYTKNLSDTGDLGQIRGYAKFDPDIISQPFSESDYDSATLLGKGHFALTLDPGNEQDRRQGIVALENTSLTDAAQHYFEQSEQISTFLRLSVARIYQKDEAHDKGRMSWRTGGLLVQKMGIGGGKDAAAPQDTIEIRGQSAQKEEEGGYEEDWNRVYFLAQTVESHELLDPIPPLENLLFKLFHEENVRVLPATRCSAFCHCSKERIISVMKNFTRAEIADMIEEDGNISVTCEFCSSQYHFSPDQLTKKP